MGSSPSDSPIEEEDTDVFPDAAEDEEEADLFPAETTNMTSNTNATNIGRPLTPQNNHLNALAPGELSPPRSQSQTTQSHPQQQQLPLQSQSWLLRNNNTSTIDDLDYGGGSSIANGNGIGNSRQGYEANSRQDTTDATAGAGDGKPGSGWKSKRAQEEYHRAMEGVVDRDFSLREFGDILAQEKRAA